DGTDVILVTGGQKKSANALTPLFEPGEKRVIDLDAQILVRKRDTAVDDEDASCLLDGEAVNSDLTEAAERNEPNFPFVQVCHSRMSNVPFARRCWPWHEGVSVFARIGASAHVVSHGTSSDQARRLGKRI